MAAPMRDGPLEGHRPRAADGRADQTNNFEYDDNEWDIGIGDLIIDLDADIEKTDEGTAGMASSAQSGPAKAAAAAKLATADHSATLDKGLKMKIKRTKPGTKTSEAKHEIVKSNEINGAATETTEGAATPPARRASAAHRRDKARDKHAVASPAASAPAPPELNGVAATTPPAPTPSPSSAATAAAVAPANPLPPVPPPAAGSEPPVPLPAAATPVRPATTPVPSPPPTKKIKTENKECADVCVGTSVGTITEPDCLGPCEPGTSVTLEGIVWHETEGGVLVVNVTWRGKTYVGTLLDCTRHDWAPPRFCDSPTEELDARTPKGRAKRGRGAVPGGDLSNFTETRSSVHSKLRNGGAKGRRGGAAGAGAPVPVASSREAPSPPSSARASPSPAPSPAPPAPPGKRKTRGPEEDSPSPSPSPAAKRRAPTSPPASPALLECPEPNCSKKYKHINGLKYHQSHAHGALEEDESKDVASLSENDESNAEAPSPAGPVKSPEKLQEPGTPRKDEASTPAPPPAPPPCVVPSPVDVAPRIPRAPSPPAPPVSSPPTPPVVASPVTPTEPKPSTVKPGVLRFGPQEDFPVANFISKPPVVSPAVAAPIPSAVPAAATLALASTVPRPPENGVPRQFSVLSQGLPQTQPAPAPSSQQIAVHSSHPILPIVNHIQHPVQQNQQMDSALPQNIGPPNRQKGMPPSPQNSQFKVKPTAALMPTDDKKLQDSLANKNQVFKKNKSRKSPGGSPHPPERQPFGIEQTGRDEVQSPAYSDISDDNAPVMESEVDKVKGLGDKKPDGTPLPHSIPPGYGMYQFFGQSPYLVSSVQNQSLTDPNKLKDDPNKPLDGKPISEKDIKREGPPENMPPQKMLPHYYPYGYMPPGYPYNMDPNYGPVSMVPEDKLKEQQERDRERSKESPSPAEHNPGKLPPASPQQQNMMSNKPKQNEMMKDGKHPNENHQILKESIEMKSQMNPYLYQRHQQQQQQAQQAQQAHQQAQQQHHQREEEMRRYYMSLEHQRRKENSMGPDSGKPSMMQQQTQGQNKPSPGQGPPKPSQGKDGKLPEDGSKQPPKEDIKPIKQEGQKPTMETTGPPPPPTSQYYLHPSYMQPPHYGGLPFDPVYRGLNPMLVSGPYGPGPYLHPGPMPRYHAPEDLSRPPQPTKTMDLLQHHPATQYYSSHKIHELQERALKSPTPKAGGGPIGSPGGAGSAGGSSATSATPSKPGAPPPTAPGGDPAAGKEARSPPPQRHVHTHHHTHVGLGYPLYPAPYGAAAVLASQQAAAVTVVNSFPPK